MIRPAATFAAIALLFAACSGGAAAQAPSAAPASAAVAPAAATPEASESTSAQSAPANARQVTIEIAAGKMTPASVAVKKGETVTFIAKNVSTEQVELIVGLKGDVSSDSGDSLKEAEEIEAGASKTVTYTFDGDGPYAYGDQVGDHYAKGAKGDIVIQP